MCCKAEQVKNISGSIKFSSHGALKHQLFICAFAAEVLAYRAVINQSRTGIERIASCGRKYNQQL